MSAVRPTATHCRTLHHTASHCNTLHHSATRALFLIWRQRVEFRDQLQQTASHCNRLHHTATDCITLQQTADHTATDCNTCTVPHSEAESGTSRPTTGNRLQPTASYYNKLHHTASLCNSLHHTAPRAKFLIQRRGANIHTFTYTYISMYI